MNWPENLKDSSKKSPFNYMMEMMGMNNNPQLQMLAEMMQQQNADQQEVSKTEEGNESRKEGNKSRKRRLLWKIEKIFEENKRLRHEKNILLERIEILAYALGACPECWGDDGQCKKCQGQGQPGTYIPEKDLFSQYVLPVVKTLRLQKTKADSPMAAHSVNGKNTGGSQANPESAKVDTSAL